MTAIFISTCITGVIGILLMWQGIINDWSRDEITDYLTKYRREFVLITGSLLFLLSYVSYFEARDAKDTIYELEHNLELDNVIMEIENPEEMYLDSLETAQINDKDYNPYLDTRFSKEALMDAIHYFNLYEPDWVYAQAVLETGNFSSMVFQRKNNLFGLYNSRYKHYYMFTHWSESVLAYKKMIQKPERYNPNVDTDYGKFLNRIKYAEDPNYVQKLKSIIENNF